MIKLFYTVTPESDIYKAVMADIEDGKQKDKARKKYLDKLGIKDFSAYADGTIACVVHPNFDYDEHDWKGSGEIPEHLAAMDMRVKADEPKYHLFPRGNTKQGKETLREFKQFASASNGTEKAAAKVAGKYRTGFWDQCTATSRGQSHGIINHKVTFTYVRAKDILLCIVPWDVDDRDEPFKAPKGLRSIDNHKVMKMLAALRAERAKEKAEA